MHVCIIMSYIWNIDNSTYIKWDGKSTDLAKEVCMIASIAGLMNYQRGKCF